MNDPQNPLPSLAELIDSAGLKKFADKMRQQPLVERLRGFLDEVRGEIRSAAQKGLPEVTSFAARLARTILPVGPETPRSVINATGVLAPYRAQAPLADAAAQELAAISGGFVTLGESPSAASNSEVTRILTQLTGAESALVFSSPASALLGVIAALAGGREVVFARSQVAKIDNANLISDLVADAGAKLREIGAASGPTAADYRANISDHTALVLRSSPAASHADSKEEVSLVELAQLAQVHRAPVVEFLPLASLLDLTQFGGPALPLVGQSILGGADLVVFSGGCVGGPACGIVVGRRAIVDQVARHRLTAALAIDLLALTALKATLTLYRDPATAQRAIPLLQLLLTTDENLEHRAKRLAPQLEQCFVVDSVEVEPGVGSIRPIRAKPEELPAWCLAITPAQGTARQLAESLQSTRPPVDAAVDGERLIVNLRSVLPREDEQLAAAFRSLGLKLPAQPVQTAAGPPPMETA